MNNLNNKFLNELEEPAQEIALKVNIFKSRV